MSIMVPGGAGLIGNKIVRKLVKRGEEVVCFDMTPPRSKLIAYLNDARREAGLPPIGR
jgi:nucleoside-diphosphate-sugar epimerase